MHFGLNWETQGFEEGFHLALRSCSPSRFQTHISIHVQHMSTYFNHESRSKRTRKNTSHIMQLRKTAPPNLACGRISFDSRTFTSFSIRSFKACWRHTVARFCSCRAANCLPWLTSLQAADQDDFRWTILNFLEAFGSREAIVKAHRFHSIPYSKTNQTLWISLNHIFQLSTLFAEKAAFRVELVWQPQGSSAVHLRLPCVNRPDKTGRILLLISTKSSSQLLTYWTWNYLKLAFCLFEIGKKYTYSCQETWRPLRHGDQVPLQPSRFLTPSLPALGQ